MFAALDVIDDKLKQSAAVVAPAVTVIANPSTNDLYLGVLHAFESYKIYGYVTNTKVKFIIIVDSKNLMLRDNELKIMFRKIHSLYIDTMFNPFYRPESEILSK